MREQALANGLACVTHELGPRNTPGSLRAKDIRISWAVSFSNSPADMTDFILAVAICMATLGSE
jgi:hypothetical protein